ncbi:MAG: polysaccharide biosynthesis tyrosine autokinase [Candidatus Cloacimonetes bacterium]|nr:polysaccharide biosynthesis tyrosine autokinase [Candidatus Cloacimonadota bacterium]
MDTYQEHSAAGGLNQFGESEEEGIKLREYARIIAQHKRIAIAVFIIVIVAGAIYTNNAQRIYRSSGKILLELEKATDLFLTVGGTSRNDLNNQIEVIKSSLVMKRAVRKLQENKQFVNFPILSSENPAGALAGGMAIETEREVDIINISFSSTNPAEAQAAVNALIDGYRELDLRYSKSEATTIRKFLEKQLDITSRKLAISEEDLREYKIMNDVFALSDEAKKLTENMLEFETELRINQTDLQVTSEKLKYLKSNLSKLDEKLGSEIVSISTPLIEQLRNRLIENESKLATFLSKENYNLQHPELLALQKENENVKMQMRTEIDKVLQVNEETFSPLDRRQELLTKIINTEADFQIVKAKVTALEKVVENYSLEMMVLPDAELELARLERSKKINEEIYSMLISRYEEAKISEEGKISNIRVLERAFLPKSPISPKVKMNIIISLILGLGLGIGSTMFLDSLNTKIITLSDVERYVKLPILGTIPNIPFYEERLVEIENEINMTSDKEKLKKLRIFQRQLINRFVPQYSPKSPISEAYRTFRTNVVSLMQKPNAKIFLITSSEPKAGKTTTCVNLAITLAQMGAKTLIIDCDLRRPVMHNLFHFEKKNGLSKYLSEKDKMELSTIIHSTEISNLDIIISGKIPANPSELLASKRMNNLVDKLREKYDYIILDTPPIIAVTDPLVIAKKADCIIFVVLAGATQKMVIDRAKQLLQNIGRTPDGVLVNGVQIKKYYGGYGYYYYYYYAYISEEDDGKKKGKFAKLFSLKRGSTFDESKSKS